MQRTFVVGLVCVAAWTATSRAAVTDVLTFHFDNVPGESYVIGGTVLDSSGYGNDGHLQSPPGVPTWLPTGHFGGAFDFTGNGATVGQTISVPHSASLNPGSGNFGIAAWILTRHDVDGDILRKGSTGVSTWYKLEHSPESANDKLSLNFNTTGTDATITSHQAYNDGQWHFVVAQREGSQAQLWIDGVLDGTAPVSGSISNNANLALGSKDTLNDDFLNSSLDEVRIYLGALSASEIEALYHATPSVPTVPAPGAVLLVALGTALVGHLRGRKTL